MKNAVNLKVFNTKEELNIKLREQIAEFLFKHLEKYGDPIEDIKKSIDYAMQIKKSFGGSIIVAEIENEIVGSVILNNTGMKGYIPETILVYIAVDKTKRGLGIGKLLMNEAIKITNGSIALHVEEDNPAKILYEKVGFKKKYAEMRLIR